MSDNLVSAMVAVVTAIIGLAALAVFLSGGGQNAATVITAGASGLSNTITAAVSPVTGGFGGVGSFNLSNQGFH